MSRTVSISDDLAARLEERRARADGVSLDALVEGLVSYALAGDAADDDQSDGISDDELRALIAEADASGPAVDWDFKALKDEVTRRSAERTKQP